MSRRHAGASVYLQRTRIMPASKECPLCGGTMKVTQNTTVTQVPGNPSATTRITMEWVCPDCDYFEEAEEESSR